MMSSVLGDEHLWNGKNDPVNITLRRHQCNSHKPSISIATICQTTQIVTSLPKSTPTRLTHHRPLSQPNPPLKRYDKMSIRSPTSILQLFTLASLGSMTLYFKSHHDYNLQEHEARMDELEGTLRGHIGLIEESLEWIEGRKGGGKGEKA
jgi:hypothetical protein